MAQTTENPNRLLTRAEAAAYLGIKPQTLAHWACAGRYALPFVRLGGRVRYRKADLDAWMASRTATHTMPADATGDAVQGAA